MSELYRTTTPLILRPETATLPRVIDTPIKIHVITDERHEVRPTGPVNVTAIKAELGTCAPGPVLNLRPRQQRGWWARLTAIARDRSTIAYLLRLHP